MAKIKLSEGFKPLPEGTYVFKITKVSYKEDYGKLELTLTTEDGRSTVERYSLMKSNGEMNEGACAAFSYMARAALNDMDVEEIDHDDLVGHFVRATVEHEQVESNKTPGKMLTFVRLTDKEPADGWGTAAKAEEAPAASMNLDELLG